TGTRGAGSDTARCTLAGTRAGPRPVRPRWRRSGPGAASGGPNTAYPPGGSRGLKKRRLTDSNGAWAGDWQIFFLHKVLATAEMTEGHELAGMAVGQGPSRVTPCPLLPAPCSSRRSPVSGPWAIDDGPH